jgi:hypothetical protein
VLRSTKRFLAAVLAFLAAAGASAQDREAAEAARYPLAGGEANGQDLDFARPRDLDAVEAEAGRPTADGPNRAMEVMKQMQSERGGAAARVPRKEVPGKQQDARAKREELLGKPKGAPVLPKGPPPKPKAPPPTKSMPAKPKAPPAAVKAPPARPKEAAARPKPPPAAPAAVPEAQKRAQVQSLEAEIAKLRKSKAPPMQIQALEVKLANLKRELERGPRAGAAAYRN